jgi:hypothetical protein
MGCGCNKGSSSSRGRYRPALGPRPVQGGLAAGPTPSQVRALGMQKSTSIGETRRMDDQRLRSERIRRDAIKKRLNKG